MSDYEQEQFDKLMTVVRAAIQNNGSHDDVEISTCGHDPSASCRIPAYLLQKFLKPPKGP